MREDITTHIEKVDKRQALADETAAKARAAEAEAEAKAAEAARLKAQAATHRRRSRLPAKTSKNAACRPTNWIRRPGSRTTSTVTRARIRQYVEQERADQAAAQQEAARQDDAAQVTQAQCRAPGRRIPRARHCHAFIRDRNVVVHYSRHRGVCRKRWFHAKDTERGAAGTAAEAEGVDSQGAAQGPRTGDAASAAHSI